MNILDVLLGRTSAPSSSGAVAKERLKIVLEYDRAQLSPGELDLIRDEIIRSISRHVDVATDAVEIKLEPGGRLVAEIPLSRRAAAHGNASDNGGRGDQGGREGA